MNPGGKTSVGISRAKVTSKGQLTVPKEIRRLLSIEDGDEVLFVSDGKRVVIERLPGRVTADQVYGRLQRPGAAPLDVEQARALVRRSRAERQVHLDQGQQ